MTSWNKIAIEFSPKTTEEDMLEVIDQIKRRNRKNITSVSSNGKSLNEFLQ